MGKPFELAFCANKLEFETIVNNKKTPINCFKWIVSLLTNSFFRMNSHGNLENRLALVISLERIFIVAFIKRFYCDLLVRKCELIILQKLQ